MDIKGTDKTKGAGGVGKTNKTAGTKNTSGTSFQSMIDAAAGAMDVENSGGIASVGAVSSLDALIAAQTVPDSTEQSKRKRAEMRGTVLLDMLDDIRMGLLSGSLSAESLTALSRAIKAQRERLDDPKLMAILDDIDLRAQVELAKYERG